MDPVLHTTLALGLSALLGAAALHKQRSGVRFEAQLAEYRLLPARVVAPTARTLGIVEIVLAAGLLLPGLREAAAVGTAALMTLYTLGIAVNLVRGRNWIDCGCGDQPVLLTPWLLARNGAVILAALAVAVPVAERGYGIVDGVVTVAALLVLCLLWAVIELLLANASVLREWNEARD